MTATRDAEADLLGKVTGELLLSSCVISVCRGGAPASGSARCPAKRRGTHGSPYPAHGALCRRRAGLSAEVSELQRLRAAELAARYATASRRTRGQHC